ncbi:MAG: ABC transporter substrate-binding protein [Deltaproteobacteria bacterium]|nr:ABC transporter substrate-binding protein [Deltaproteobacteria bacterium]
MRKVFGIRSLTSALCALGLAFAAGPAPASEPIVIGVPTALTSLEGREGFKALTMAVEEINAKGGVKVGKEKRPFKVESIDTRDSDPGVPVSDAILGHEKLILEKKAKFIVFGAFRSEAAVAAMDVVAKYKIPMILGTAMAPAVQKKVTEDYEKYKYTFRVCLNAPYLVQYLAGTMEHIKTEFGFTKVMVMHQDVAWARGTADALVKSYFNAKGWEVVGQEAYPTGAGDFSAALMKAKAKGAQVIVPIFDMPQSGTLVKQWNTMRVPALVAGFVSPLSGPGAWKTFGAEIDGDLNVIFESGAIPIAKIPESVTFWNAYKKRWGDAIEAGHAVAPAYDMVYVLADAIERAGTLDGDAVVAALEKTDRKGAIGRIRFGKDHQVVYGFNPAETAMAAVTEWRAGKREVVFPESIAETKIRLPADLKPAK